MPKLMGDFSRKPKEARKIVSRHRRIEGMIPATATHSTIEKSLRYEPYSMNADLPLVWEKAVDYQVYDSAGNCWIDFTSCIFVANTGHGHPRIVAAMREVLDKPLLNSYYYPTKYRADFAEILVKQMPENINSVLFLSTGAEASEAATKIALINGRKKSSTKEIILAFEGSFHGKTMGAQTLGGKDAGKKWIGYFHPKIVHLPYPYPWTLKEKGQTGREFFQSIIQRLNDNSVRSEDVAAIMMEPYQGWCGVFFPQDFMDALREWAHKNEVLIGFDEVQAGFGRTGYMFGYQYYKDLVPDIVWCGKAISGSIPVSAVLANRSHIDVDGSLNSTHGGNPIGMAASYASMQVLLDESLVEESARKGRIVEGMLRDWAARHDTFLLEVFGSGLMWAVLVRDRANGDLQIGLVDQLVEECFRQGVLSIRTASGSIKLGPPLTIPDEALTEGINVIIETFERLCQERPTV
jgi:4-aminobutyrate aminotransferase-like enzyme